MKHEAHNIGSIQPSKGEARPLYDFLKLFLLTLPLVIKLEELRFSALALNRAWPGLLDPAILVIAWLYGDAVVRGRAKLIWLAILLLVNLLLIAGFIGYLQLGGFYRPELFASQSLSRVFVTAKSFLTRESASSILQIVLQSTIATGIATFALRRFRPALSSRVVLHASAIGVIFYGVAVAILAPPRIEGLRLSLAVTFGSLASTQPPKVNWQNPPSSVDLTAPVAPMPLPEQSKPYNLVVYVMESTRFSVLQANGSQIGATPFLDQMVRTGQGIFFERAYTVAARSIKGLTAMTLNTYPMMDVSSWAWTEYVELIDSQQTLPGILSANGFLTAFFVNSTVDFDNRHEFLPHIGFQIVEGIEEFVPNDDRPLVGKLRTYLDRAQSEDKPLFAMLLSATAHVPYKHPEGDPHSLQVDSQMAALEARRLNMKGIGVDNDYLRYLRSVRHQDEVARLLYEELKASGHLENTIFVIVGDHGQTFGEHQERNGLRLHGQSLYEASVRIPLWMHHPTMPGGRFKEPVQLIDLPPTWLALLGTTDKTQFVGRNVFVEPRAELFFANFTHWPAFALLAGDRKLICAELPLKPENCELYNVYVDPYERNPMPETDEWFLPMYERLKAMRREISHLQYAQALDHSTRALSTVK